MLTDIESGRISSVEQLVYLFLIFMPDTYFFSENDSGGSNFISAVLDFGAILLSFILFYCLTRNDIDKTRVIEKYICLSVPAIVTSYVFLIPLSFFAEAALRDHVSGQMMDLGFGYFLSIYLPLYVPAAMYLWQRKHKS